MYSHSKRMLPRKDEPFRTEFPSHYYSSSSVYSYTPTSSSDCPEHGRSHRRTTLILTISVIFATLGVLSIAGVAAYLGILSKGHNNASQTEESFMLLNSNSKTLSSDDESESEIFYGNGRSSHRDLIADISNTLIETKPDSTGLPGYENVDSGLQHHVNQQEPVPLTKVRFSQRNSTSMVTSKVNVNVPTSNLQFNFNEEHISSNTPPQNNNHDIEMMRSDVIEREPVIVKTTSTVVQQQSSTSQSQQQQYPVRYSSSSQQQHGSPPPLIRYPPTNSHYTTHIVDNDENRPNHFLTNFDSESLSLQRNPVVTSGILNFHDFHDSKNESTHAAVNDKITLNNNVESKVTRKEGQQTQYINKPPSASNYKQLDDVAVLIENGQGLADSGGNHVNLKKIINNNKDNSNPISSFTKNKNEGNESGYRGTTTTITSAPTRHLSSANNKSKQRTPPPPIIQIKPSAFNVGLGGDAENSREQFMPMKPFFKTRTSTPPSEYSEDTLNNHRVQLTFDRIGPEFYDKNPWTPLVFRPNLNKKPRVDAEEMTVLTPGAEPPAAISIPAQSKEMYYRYGDTTSNVNVNVYGPKRDQDNVDGVNSHIPSSSSSESDQGEGAGNNGPTRHALESDHNVATIKQNDGVKLADIPAMANNTSIIVSTSIITSVDDDGIKMQPSMSVSSQLSSSDITPVEEDEHEKPWDVEDEVVQQPPPIPSYTVLIPHIPNPKPKYDNIENKQEKEINTNSDVIRNTSDVDTEVNTNDEIDRVPSPSEPTQPPAVGTFDLSMRNNSIVTPFKDKHKNAKEDNEEKLGELVQEDNGNLKDDEYNDNDDILVETSPQTKIYKLDAVNLDVLPNSVPTEASIVNTINVTSSEESLIKGPIEPDFHIRTTTDFILSTLGSLNLVKPSPTKSENESDGKKTESPLFPPIRSYVGINQPLRPKPNDESDESSGEAKIILLSEPNFIMHSDPHRKLRTEDDVLSPDLTTTSSFNKVLSMMMKFDTENKTGVNTIGNLTTQNVQLVVAHANYTAPLAAYFNDTNREQKSFHRDAKIDSRFRDFTEQIPVALISSGPSGFHNFPRPSKSNLTVGKWNPNKLSSITVTNSNSPVYKFVLRKGQSVEELLKEIFHNYTNKGIGNSTNSNYSVKSGLPPAANIITTRPEVPGSSPGSVDIQFTPNKTTTNRPLPNLTTTTMEVPLTTTTDAFSTTMKEVTTHETSTEQEIYTSTSIAINNEKENCPTNSSFLCISSGTCISSFARCNGIRDCPDNSDEKGCLCVDFLRSQMLHRKICDGIPDCKDFSDEYQCEWCTPGQYICAGSRACIPRDRICDGKRDCPRGDDEGDCVKIGHTGEVDELEDLSPTYHRSGHLMVRKKGVWGKLCVETFSTVLSHWEVKDLARAVCKAKTFSDFETVERVEDEEFSSSEPYYELYDGINQNDSAEASYPSSESAPRSSIGFKLSPCKTKVVVKVTCQDLQCGTAPRAFTQAARIVGGSNALAGEWPWQAALYRDGEYQCGATLISSRWLLSAGHCFYHSQDDHWVARLGTLRRGATILSPYEQVIRITHIFLHPQYKDVGFINDVSLLRLEKEVNFTDFVRPVCLPSKNTHIRDGRMCTVVGWGQLFEVGRVFPDTLQEVQLPLISTTECRKRTLFLPLYKLTDEMFCAGFDRGGRDACLGDSGGPLMCPESDGRWSLYGVTSNGYGCARANRPGVYTKVASYLDWIYDKMNKHSTVSYRDKAKPCHGHRCPLGECLEQRRLCNGFADCLDASDERNCTWS